MTALHTHVYLFLDRPLKILNECIQVFHEDRYREACEGHWRATVSVQRRGPRAKTTEVKARVALVCASTDDGRPLTDGKNLVWTVVEGSPASGAVYHKR